MTVDYKSHVKTLADALEPHRSKSPQIAQAWNFLDGTLQPHRGLLQEVHADLFAIDENGDPTSIAEAVFEMYEHQEIFGLEHAETLVERDE